MIFAQFQCLLIHQTTPPIFLIIGDYLDDLDSSHFQFKRWILDCHRYKQTGMSGYLEFVMPRKIPQKSVIPTKKIARKIYFIRGQKVMLDRD